MFFLILFDFLCFGCCFSVLFFYVLNPMATYIRALPPTYVSQKTPLTKHFSRSQASNWPVEVDRCLRLLQLPGLTQRPYAATLRRCPRRSPYAETHAQRPPRRKKPAARLTWSPRADTLRDSYTISLHETGGLRHRSTSRSQAGLAPSIA